MKTRTRFAPFATPLVATLLVGMFSSAFSPPAPAQETAKPKSSAEERFHAAFWQETGQGRLDVALQGYLAAADAIGPDAIRARALLQAAVVQHRLDKRMDALATLQKMFAAYPNEKAIVEAGKSRLEEWKKIDARRSYSDWYQAHLFSPAVQSKVLELLQRLAKLQAPKRRTRALTEKYRSDLAEIENEILVYGQGAAPALMEMAKTGVSSGNKTLTQRSTRLIFLIGRLPPVDALLVDTLWMGENRAWRTMFRINADEKQALSVALRDKSSDTIKLLKSAAEGPRAMLPLIGGELGSTLAHRNSRGLSALLHAMHGTADPGVIQGLVRLSTDKDTPVLVREAVENAISSYGWPLATSEDWLHWSRNRQSWHAATIGIRRAAEQLRKADTKILDSLFSRIESTPPRQRESVFYAVIRGLDRNTRPLQIPWTEDRLFRLLLIHPNEDVGLQSSLGHFWRTPEGRTMIASAILRRPGQIRELLTGDSGTVESIFRMNRGDEGDGILEQAWNDEVVKQVKKRWDDWRTEDRDAAIAMICSTHLLSTEIPFPAALDRMFKKLEQNPNHAEAVKAGLVAVAERWK